MSFTHITKSGKVVKTANGVTTITQMKGGQQVTKTYDMNNMTSNTVIGGASHVKISANPCGVQSGPGVPVGGVAGRASQRVNVTPPNPNPPQIRGNPNRVVSNQFNITGSVIGQVAIGNKGPTTFNSQTKEFKAGSSNVDYKISGGNFSQANIGGEATYNNKDTTIDAGGKVPRPGDGIGIGYTFQDLLNSNMVAENKVLSILRTGINADDFVALLKKGHKVDAIATALGQSPNTNTMVQSMLRYDATEDNDTSDSSDSD